MTRLVLMSDLHDRPAHVPQGDVLVIAGDFTCGDDELSLRSDLSWIKSLGFLSVVAVVGNHDLSLMHALRTKPQMVDDLLQRAGITLLRDAETEVNGLRFYGVGWQSQVVIPAGMDIVVSHCPAKGMVDQRQPTSEHLGDEWLAKQVARVKPRLVVSGHFHGGYGRQEYDGTTFVNCSLANEARQGVNKPWVVEI
jgi:Icc-related predicted phosphoesterase